MNWITAEAALVRLRIKPQSLYAYASRGRIATRPDDADSRRSLYSAEDIERLTARKRRGRGAEAVATSSMSFGDPVLSSAIATLRDGRLYYRGRDAVHLSDAEPFEAVCALLWGAEAGEDPFAALDTASPGQSGPDARSRAFALLARRAAADPALSGRSAPALRAEAAQVMSELVDAVCGHAGHGPLPDRLARAWDVEPARADPIRRVLVLLADHELHTSAFAARVTASTGASLAACALAGLATLSGPLHGGAAAQVAAFLDEAKRSGDARAAALQRLAQGLEAPGFGHLLYPLGDPRARAMAQALPWSKEIAEVARVCEAVTGQAPNIDFALVATARTLGLPADAPFALFAIGRAAGWFAHALEQRASGHVIRPRARYVGPEPEPNEPAAQEPTAQEPA